MPSEALEGRCCYSLDKMFPFKLSPRVMHSGMEPRTNTLKQPLWDSGSQLRKETDSAPAGGRGMGFYLMLLGTVKYVHSIPWVKPRDARVGPNL